MENQTQGMLSNIYFVTEDSSLSSFLTNHPTFGAFAHECIDISGTSTIDLSGLNEGSIIVMDAQYTISGNKAAMDIVEQANRYKIKIVWLGMPVGPAQDLFRYTKQPTIIGGPISEHNFRTSIENILRY